MKKVVIAGGTGFLGHAIAGRFADAGYEVVILSRSGKKLDGCRIVVWDAKGPGTWYEEVNSASVVINLAGETILQTWTKKALETIRESRIGTTCLIGAAINASPNPATVWINASAVGIYEDSGHREISEASPASQSTLGRICQEWEAEVDKADTPKTRKVKVRIGVVLGKGSDLFNLLSKLTKFYAGAALGSGRQYMPWIHIYDLTELFFWLAENNVHGAVNGTSPNPVTNNELMANFRKSMARPPVPNVPKIMVEMISNTKKWDKSLLLGSCRVVPAIALANGFKFKFSRVEDALEDLIDETPRAWKSDPASA